MIIGTVLNLKSPGHALSDFIRTYSDIKFDIHDAYCQRDSAIEKPGEPSGLPKFNSVIYMNVTTDCELWFWQLQ